MVWLCLQWYWTYDKKNGITESSLGSAMWNVTVFHLGTLAFGSLVMTVVRMVRVILEYVERKVKYFNNDFARFTMNRYLCRDFSFFYFRCLLSCCKCCLWCLEKFLRFINRNAYIMCTIKVACDQAVLEISFLRNFSEHQLLFLC